MKHETLQKALLRCLNQMSTMENEPNEIDIEKHHKRMNAIMRLYLLSDNN